MHPLPLVALVIAGQALAQTVVVTQVPAAEDLYVLSRKVLPSGSGKAVEMNFREIEREPESSLVEISIDSGADPAAWVPMLQGMCGLMHARQHTSAVSEQVSVQPLRFRITFPNSPKIDDQPGLPRLVLSEKECAAISRPHE